jgi:hypothetical protein
MYIFFGYTPHPVPELQVGYVELPEDLAQGFLKIWDGMQHGFRCSCGWAEHEGRPKPIFFHPRADEIYENMLRWSDNNPNDYFYFSIQETPTEFTVALMPNVDRMRDKISQQYAKKLGKIDFRRDVVLVLPLHCVLPRELFQGMTLPKSMDMYDIGIGPESILDRGNVAKSNEVYWLTDLFTIDYDEYRKHCGEKTIAL